jgi:cytochrome c553
MKYISLLLAMPPAILAMVFSTTSFAAGTDTVAISRQDIQAKIQYCQDCHGLSGQGYSGFLPIPRIAGQTTKYIESQLLAFIESRRDKNISVDMPKVHDVSPAMRPALAAHFSSLNPEPIGDGPRDLVATGKTIYAEGVPEANVPACSGCHGPEAKGKAEIPRLAGQLYSYTEKELTDWSKERGQNPPNEGVAAVMTPVAHSLSQPQIATVAAYLSYLNK